MVRGGKGCIQLPHPGPYSWPTVDFAVNHSEHGRKAHLLHFGELPWKPKDIT